MAHPSRALIVALGLAALAWGDEASPGVAERGDLQERLARLKEELQAGGERLDTLGRQLQQTSPSIFADTGRPYTAQEQLSGATTSMWMILCGALTLFINCGLTLLKAGCARVRHVQHVFLLGIWDVCMATIAWWIAGYSLALSGPFGNKTMLGYERFAGHLFLQERESDGQVEPTERVVAWFFSWSLCTVATSVVSGGLVERNFAGYCLHCLLSSTVIFPIVMAWSWGRGWLFKMDSPGFQDWAGSGVIHFTGGLSALVGSLLAGPRPGRFEGLTIQERVTVVPENFIPHSQPLVVFGTLCCWFGWYGLACGLTFGVDTVERGMLAAQVCMNTTIAAAVGGLTALLVQFLIKRKNDLDGFCFGIRAGLVSISAGCASVECGTAAGIGAAGGLLYPVASAFLKLRQIDDPVDAFPVHGICGAWGLIALTLLDWGKGFDSIHATNGFFCFGRATTCDQDGSGGSFAAATWAGIGAMTAWVGGLSAIAFCVLKGCRCLAFTDATENDGADRTKHIPTKAYSFGVLSSANLSLNSI